MSVRAIEYQRQIRPLVKWPSSTYAAFQVVSKCALKRERGAFYKDPSLVTRQQERWLAGKMPEDKNSQVAGSRLLFYFSGRMLSITVYPFAGTVNG